MHDGGCYGAGHASSALCEQRITIAPASGDGASAVSGAYELGPDGLSFAKDAVLCMGIAAGADTATSCLGYRAADGTWVCEDRCLKKEGSMLCGSTHHFTSFAVLLGSGQGASTTCEDALIGPTGGSLASPDGLATLTVPAGALAAPTRITVARAPVVAPSELVSEPFEFSPDGTKFAAKVELCITPKPDAVLRTACLGCLGADQKWVCEDTCLEAKGNALCGTTDHFTSFAILLGGGSGASSTCK